METLREGFENVTAVLALPEKYRRRIRSTNMVERLIEEVRRREPIVPFISFFGGCDESIENR